jgi:hypothetical protein
LEAFTEKYSRKTLSTLKRRWPAESRLQRKQLSEFRKRLVKRWNKPLEALRLLLTISRELGDSINREAGGTLSKCSQKHLSQVLRALHARACQVTEEIVCLLEGGFADGAIARWRTLHEIAVVASFLAENGEELAERYVLHQYVESKKASDKYQNCQHRLGYQPLLQCQVQKIKHAHDEVVRRFGDAFKEQYGWAAHYVRKGNPSFADIEAAVDKAHLRAHYQLASHNVHANPKGAFFKLGLFDEGQTALLAGPSNAGLEEPGQCAAMSLAQISATLLKLQPTIDNAIALKIIDQLMYEIPAAFGEAHERLLEDEAAQKGRRG